MTERFIVWRRNEAGRKAKEEHYERCEAEDKPYLAVQVKKKYANIDLDLVALTKDQQGALHDVTEEAVLACRLPGIAFSVGSFCCWVMRIPIAAGMELVKQWANVVLDDDDNRRGDYDPQAVLVAQAKEAERGGIGG